MLTRSIWTAIIGFTLASGVFALGDEKQAADSSIQADVQPIQTLIQQLGAEQFLRREEAAAKIMSLGIAALPAVETGAEDSDLEIRYRCEDLRGKLVRADLQQRLEAFASDTAGKGEHRLALWDRFAAAFGTSSAARKLFIDMYRQEPELLMRCELERESLTEFVPARALLMQQSFQLSKGTFSSVVLLLFAGGEEQVKLNDQTLNVIISGCYQPLFQQEMSHAETSEVVKKILSRFIAKCEGWSAQQALNIAAMYNLPEGISLARKIAKNPVHAHMLSQALPFIAKQGSLEDLPLLEGLLENRTVITNIQMNNVRYQTQVRDCALASMLFLLLKEPERLQGTVLASKDLKAFGFSRLETNTSVGFAAHTVGFAEDRQRDEVFSKWSELKKQLAAQPKK